jgi:Fe-S cluster biogenesis protein NfuA
MKNPESSVDVRLEFTPNPNTLKFVVDRTFLERGAANFPDSKKAAGSPLAEALFKVQGISGVMIGTNFVTITKAPDGDWDVIAEEVPKTVNSHFKSGADAVSPGLLQQPTTVTGSTIEDKIREVLDNEIRPAVAMDGGDITFGRYEDGIVYLHLQGSCSSCPSSVATLKMGVESRLKDVIPEIKEVVQI